MPSWLLDENYQLYLLLGFFCTVILVPVALIAKVQEQRATGVEVHEDTHEMLETAFMQALDKNMSKKGLKLTDAQLSDIYSESVEFI